MTHIKGGEVFHVGERASVQFAGDRALIFRVIRVHNWSTYDHWIWLDGYVLGPKGDAVERRTIFVQPAGLRRLSTTPKPRNTRQHTLPPAQRVDRPARS